MLNIVIGLIFILLLFSLLGTTVMELISSMLSLRGKNLERALQRMLSSPRKGQLFKTFTNNIQYRQIQSKFFIWRRPPSYLSAQTFSSILWSMLFNPRLMEGRNMWETIDSIQNEEFKVSLQQIFLDSGSEPYLFRRNVEAWYDEVMARSGGWYKRNTQFILLVVGIFIAVIFNVDTISVYDKLSKDPEAQFKMMELTGNYLNSAHAQGLESPNSSQLHQEVIGVLYQNIDDIQTPLGMGWNNFEALPTDLNEWLYRILGWLTTALAVSLGAPFWFDILKRVVNIRGAGRIPAPPPSPAPYQSTPRTNNTGIPSDSQIPKSYG